MSEPIHLTRFLEFTTELTGHAALDWVYEQVKHLQLSSIVLDEETKVYTVTYNAEPEIKSESK